MKASEEFIDKIPDYFDNSLSVNERLIFEKLMESDPGFRARVKEFETMESLLKLERPEEPSSNFTHVVMVNLHKKPLQIGFSFWNTLIVIGGVLVLVALCLVIMATGVFDSPTTIDLNNNLITDKYLNKDLPSIPFNGKIVLNTVIFLNLVLALLVLDRGVFKPLFHRRMNHEV